MRRERQETLLSALVPVPGPPDACTEGTVLVTWRADGGGWLGVLCGVGPGGQWFESDPIGPYPTRLGAETVSREIYQEALHEEAPRRSR